jgi:uncharacterized protein (TIGR03083 family)
MEMADIYRETWERMTAIGRSLDDGDGERPCPATPEWTVKDVYAHQAGAAADILAGRLDGVATDAWTARQVEERHDLGLGQILDEWDTTAPQIEAIVRSLGDAMDPRLLIDQWTHEQDIRQAVDQPGGRASSAAQFAKPRLTGAFDAAVQRAGLTPVEVVQGEHSLVAGDGEPVARLEVDEFDFLRASMGRRSPAQMHAWSWTCDPAPYVAVLPIFGPRTDDLLE